MRFSALTFAFFPPTLCSPEIEDFILPFYTQTFCKDGFWRIDEEQNEAEQIDCVPEQLILACNRVL